MGVSERTATCSTRPEGGVCATPLRLKTRLRKKLRRETAVDPTSYSSLYPFLTADTLPEVCEALNGVQTSNERLSRV